MTHTRFTFTIFALFISLSISALNAKPDFAYPQKTSEQAIKNLEQALKKNDGEMTVQSLVQLTVAQSLISSDNLPGTISRIEKATIETKDQCTKALLYLLLADIYSDIYDSDRWKYNQRNNPPLPLPADYNTWDGAQFHNKIMSLCDSALSNPKILQSDKLSNYKSIITHDRNTFTFYPTLYDFIARHAINILEQSERSETLLPISWLCRHDAYMQLKFTYASPTTQRILKIYRNLLELNAKKPAAFIDCDLARIKFLSSSVYRSRNNTGTITFEILQDLYYKNIGSEYSAEILYALKDIATTDSQQKWLYDNIRMHLKRNPTYFRNGCLEQVLTELSSASISLSTHNTVIPGDTLKITINNRNVTDFKLEIYRIPDSEPHLSRSYSWQLNKGELPMLVESIDITTDSIIPFRHTQTCSTVIKQPGCYIIVPSTNGNGFKDNRYYDVIFCTNLALIGTSYADKTWACTVNPLTGEPISNADIYEESNRRSKIDKKVATTDKNGYAEIKNSNRNIYAQKDGNRSSSEPFYKTYTGNTTEYYASCFTNLPIYHPGDTVKWNAIVYANIKQSQRLIPNEQFSVAIRDVNYRIISTTSETTDEWGRISGSFRVPTDGLTGIYRIQINNSETKNISSCMFTVSDYKLPTFFTEVTNIQIDAPTTGAVTINGIAETYSGFPLADIDINITLSVKERLAWRYTSRSIPFYTSTAKTDGSGQFSIEFPAELFATTPIPDGIYTVSISAKSSTGESRETSKSFIFGKPYNISVSLDRNINISSAVKPDILISDINGNAINDTVSYEIKQGDKLISAGSFLSSANIVDWSKIPSGNYAITFGVNDKSIADPITIDDINLYRPTDKMPPENTPLWIPETDYKIKASNRKASVLYGTSVTNSHIDCTVWDNNRIISQEWITPTPGLHRYPISLPDSVNNLTVTFRTVNNYRLLQKSISISVENSTPSIKIEAESFRNKITPGEKETWKFRIKDNTGKGIQSALIFDMYSKALDYLKPAKWNFDPIKPQRNHFRSITEPFGNALSFSSFIERKNSNCPSLITPEIDSYGYPFVQSPQIMFLSRARGATEYKSTATVHDSAINIMDEAVMEESADFGEMQGLNTPDNRQDDDRFSYRASEYPLAFYNPTLTTDSNGELTFTFYAPNANTKWRFCAIAYTQGVITDTFSQDVVSNKPLMVQPNMPRFLRTGDQADIMASVMNNTDSVMVISTTVEIFDHASGIVYNRYSHIDTVPAGKSSVITTHINTPINSPLLGYRIKSSNGTFADGEQSFIPILPSITPVIESNPFYIPHNAQSFKMQIPEIPDDAHVTLQFCENPAWYCVTALPGLRKENGRTSLDAMSALFSAAIAQGIMRNYPEIASALYKWQTSDRSDSTLVSMLEKNQDLKTMLLNATPWLMDARNDSERMTRLSLILDKNETEQVYSRNITRLAELQRGKGGWGWIAENTEPSQWCTINILQMCGRLKQLGYLPDEPRLNTMITNAIKYLDDKNARNYSKNPKEDYSQYVFTRDYFPDIKQSTAAQRVTSATVQRLISEWKQLNTEDKAIAAIILNNNSYHSTARQILASLREFASKSAEKGMWWPSLDKAHSYSMSKIGAISTILDAFHDIEPECDDINMIRQWLILQKEATDWGTSLTTSSAIASILNTGTHWTRPAHNAVITIGDKEITPSKIDTATGYFRSDISTLSPSGKKLSIIKPGNQPSWGAVFSQFTQTMNEVKATSCDAVSIEKHMFRQSIKGGDAEWEAVDEFSLGDRIKIELLVKVTQDMDYVSITDDRAACFEPIEQLPRPIFTEGIYFYRENRDAVTNIFVTRLPKGTYLLTYEMTANNIGKYSSGIATIQSQYAPSMTAHSAGNTIDVKL